MPKLKPLSSKKMNKFRDELIDHFGKIYGDKVTIQDMAFTLCSIASEMAYDCAPTKADAAQVLNNGIVFGLMIHERDYDTAQ